MLCIGRARFRSVRCSAGAPWGGVLMSRAVGGLMARMVSPAQGAMGRRRRAGRGCGVVNGPRGADRMETRRTHQLDEQGAERYEQTAGHGRPRGAGLAPLQYGTAEHPDGS